MKVERFIRTWRNVVILMAVLVVVGILRAPIHKAIAQVPNFAYHILNSSNVIMNGATASATAASPNGSFYAVNDTNHIINTFGGTSNFDPTVPGPIGGTTSGTFQGTQVAIGPSVPTLFSGTTVVSNVTGPKLMITYNPTADNLGISLWLKSPATSPGNSVLPFAFTPVGNPTHPTVWLDESGGFYSKNFVVINGSANPILDAHGNLTTTADFPGFTDAYMFGIVPDLPGHPAMITSVTPSSGGTNNTDMVWCGKDSGTNSTAATTRFRLCIDGTGKLQWDAGTSASLSGATFDTTLQRVAAGALQVSNAIGATPVNLSTLPTCAAGTEGLYGTQNDAAVACVAGVTAAAGGTTHCALYCNGTNWVRTGL